MGLDTVEFILWAEDQFGIEIPDEDASHILTVGQFCQYLADKTAVKEGIHALTYSAIFDQVTNRLITEYKVSPGLISEHAQFVKDLGLE